MRWGRLAFHDNSLSYQEIAELSENAEPCCGGLIFLPYLTGERNALHKNTRAQFFGLTRNHRIGDMHRAILEGAAFGARRCLEELTSNCGPITKLVASGGGARSTFVLSMKASIYGLPIVRSEEPENGLVGCAMIAGMGMELYEDAEAATHACVHLGETIAPDPQWQRSVIKRPMRFSATFMTVLCPSTTVLTGYDQFSHNTAVRQNSQNMKSTALAPDLLCRQGPEPGATPKQFPAQMGSDAC